MIVCELRPLDQDEQALRRNALRSAVICIGWMKLMSVLCYVMLYSLILTNSKGHMSTVLQIMTLATIPLQVLHGILLFLGALEKKVLALQLALWLSLVIASYNTVLGAMGGIYFIRTGYLTMHFLLAVIFFILAMSLFSVLCHDFQVIYAYIKMLRSSTYRQNYSEVNRAATPTN